MSNPDNQSLNVIKESNLTSSEPKTLNDNNDDINLSNPIKIPESDKKIEVINDPVKIQEIKARQQRNSVNLPKRSRNNGYR